MEPSTPNHPEGLLEPTAITASQHDALFKTQEQHRTSVDVESQTSEDSVVESSGSRVLLTAKEKGWAGYSSLEKSLIIALTLVSIIAVGLMIAVIIVGIELNEDDYKPPLQQTTETALPPWLTTIQTTTPDGGGEGPGDGETISPRPTTLVPPPDEMICQSEACIQASKRINEWLNAYVNPCEDFYTFACGGWLSAQEESEGSENEVGLITHFTNLEKMMRMKMQELLENKGNENLPISKANLMYRKCVEYKDKATSNDVTTLQNFMTGIFNTNDTEKGNSAALMGNLRRMLLANYLFTLNMKSNDTALYISIEPAQFSHPVDILKYPTGYLELIQNVWNIVYPDDKLMAPYVAEQVIGVEKALQRARNVKGINVPVKTTIKAYLETNRKFDWHTYLSHALNMESVPENLELHLTTPAYISTMEKIVQERSRNPKILENYLKWKVIEEFGQLASTKIRSIFENFDNSFAELMGSKTSTVVSSSVCVYETTALFPELLTSVLAQSERLYSPGMEEDISDFLDDMKVSLFEILGASTWVKSESTRELIKDYFENFTIRFDGQEWLSKMENDSMSLLTEMYDNLNFTSESTYFQAYLEYISWKSESELNSLNNGSVETIRDPVAPFNVELSYNSEKNQIVIPISWLFGYPFYGFYNENMTALSYGTLAMHMGYKITDLLYEQAHDLLKWDMETKLGFQGQLQCFREEIFGNGTVLSESQERGNWLVRQSSALIGGFQLASQIFEDHILYAGDKSRVVGLLQYNEKQIFHITAMQSTCALRKMATNESILDSNNLLQLLNHDWVQLFDTHLDLNSTWGCHKQIEEDSEANSTCLVW